MYVFDGFCVQGPLWHNNQEPRRAQDKVLTAKIYYS